MSLLPTFLRRRRNCHHNSSPSILPPRLSRPPPVQPLAIRVCGPARLLVVSLAGRELCYEKPV
ncbi:hypothetical protein C0Q70_04225 [Pomacea canaliculata]|uniref:Uncharacterized protein n=1 Tax=Pomacea canaliculata TaxID=400727 RepID=A0A2T7PV07_POMCA|nr:hypothetical protein C0Q70_04225 [Pomacea canaliculata]